MTLAELAARLGDPSVGQELTEADLPILRAAAACVRELENMLELERADPLEAFLGRPGGKAFITYDAMLTKKRELRQTTDAALKECE